MDIERLKVDADYWVQLGAPEDATHYSPEKEGFDPCWMKFDGTWRAKYTGTPKDSWGFDDPDDNPARYIPRPTKNDKLMNDNCLAAKIGEVGNMIHNLGCENQNNEDLSDELGMLASALWDLSKHASKEPIETEWVDGLPPVGWEFEFSYNGVSWEERVMLFNDGITCLMAHRKYPANRWHYKSDDPDIRCRPIQTPEQRQREELVDLIENRSDWGHSQQMVNELADAILSKYNVTEK